MMEFLSPRLVLVQRRFRSADPPALKQIEFHSVSPSVLSGPMMKLVYKLQAEEYKYEIPVNYLPVRTFHSDLHFLTRTDDK